MHILCFNQIHFFVSLLLTFPYSPTTFSSQLHVLFSFVNPLSLFSDAWMFMGPCSGAWVDSQGALFWRKLTLPPQEIINSSSRRNDISWAPPPSILDFHWPHHVQSQPVWVHMCSGTVMARNTVSLQYMFPLALTVCSPEFCNDPWTSSGRDMIPMPPRELSKPQSLVLYVLTNYGYWLPCTTKRCLSDESEETFFTVPRRNPSHYFAKST